jgi:ubiquinone/menaquinone biosynthesis C-methylase UbiE
LKDLVVIGWKNKLKVMQLYDLTSEMYEERYAEEQKAKYLIALKNVEVTEAAVLDVGCGSGLFFKEAAPKASFIIGVDISRKLLQHAKQQAGDFGNVLVLQADADHLPFQNGFFDVVLSFTVLQNMPKPSATLSELKRVTKPVGRVVVTGLKRFFSLTLFTDLLEAAGFTIVSFDDSEELKCYVSVLVDNT